MPAQPATVYDGYKEEFDALPTHPLDEDKHWLRFAVLGPLGEVKEGPF